MALKSERPAPGADAEPGGLPASARLLERETELGMLRAAVSDAAAGQARLVVIEGAAGIGKTRLLAETRGLAQRAKLRLLSARGGELEIEFAFGVVRQLFEPAIADTGESVFAGAADAARGLFERAGSAGVMDEPDDRSFALLHGLYWLTVGLTGEGPVAIVVDDLHWIDAASLRFLAYLVHRLEELPVLVACSLRPGERADSPALEALRSDPLRVLVRPRTLSVAATTSLVAARLGDPADPAFASACHDATGGNPLLLHELLKTLAVEGVPPDAERVAEVSELGVAASRSVLARLAGLSRDAVRLAHAAAVLGDDAELPIAAALAGVELERAVAGATELARVEVLDARPTLRFVHPLVGEAIYRDMPGPDQALWHQRAADLLADADGNPERVAAHLLLSPSRGRRQVVRTLVTAAHESIRRGSAESAVAYLQRALREPPPHDERAELLLALGRAETLIHGLSSVEHLTQAYELLENPKSRAAAAYALSRILLLTGDPVDGARLARTAAAQLPPELEDARRQLEALELMALLIAGGGADALARLERHRETPVGPGLGAKMLAAMAAQAWAASGGSADACSRLALEALAGGDLIAADAGLLAAGPIEILTLADRQEAVDASREAIAHARGAGSLFDFIAAGLWHSFVLYWRGELVGAGELIRRADEEAGLWNVKRSSKATEWGIDGPARVYGDVMLSGVLRERGKLDEARSVLERSSDGGDDGEAARYWMHCQLELLVAEGRMREAVAASEAFETRFSKARDAVNTPWRSPTALALYRLGRVQEAVELAREDLDAARRWGAPGTVARALRILGTVQGQAGIDTLEQAVKISAGTAARLQHAKALAEFGGALRGSGRRSDARTPLRRALELAEVLGADRLAEHVRTDLYAAGARPRMTAPGGIAGLTPTERSVAVLAATGHTNRQIAQELFITPKTVEMHLSRVYAKLQIGSRRELKAHAALLQDADRSP